MAWFPPLSSTDAKINTIDVREAMIRKGLREKGSGLGLEGKREEDKKEGEE